MNSFAQAVLYKFNSPQNKKHLKSILDRQFPNNTLNMEESMTHFSKRVEEELYLSDPIGTADYQVKCFNLQFLEDRATYIRSDLKPTTPVTKLTDGYPGGRYKPNLESWKLHNAPAQIMRDDMQACNYNAYNDFGCGTANIMSCDQSNVNTSYHVEAFFTPWMKAMNSDVDANDAGFGNPTPQNDARLMSRQVFRNNNQIPQYEQRLQRRALERNIDETIRLGGERSYMQHGFDQSTIDNRASLIQNRNFDMPPKVDQRKLPLGFKPQQYW